MPRFSPTTIPPVGAAVTGITALAGGGRAGSPVVTAGYTEVATVATAADSIQLPAALFGMQLYVHNAAAANSMQVFANGSDTINGVAGATGVAQAATKGAIYECYADGKWSRILSA